MKSTIEMVKCIVPADRFEEFEAFFVDEFRVWHIGSELVNEAQVELRIWFEDEYAARIVVGKAENRFPGIADWQL